MKCNKCGAEQETDVKFCTQCGAPMENENQASAENSAESAKPASEETAEAAGSEPQAAAEASGSEPQASAEASGSEPQAAAEAAGSESDENVQAKADTEAGEETAVPAGTPAQAAAVKVPEEPQPNKKFLKVLFAVVAIAAVIAVAALAYVKMTAKDPKQVVIDAFDNVFPEGQVNPSEELFGLKDFAKTMQTADSRQPGRTDS